MVAWLQIGLRPPLARVAPSPETGSFEGAAGALGAGRDDNPEVVDPHWLLLSKRPGEQTGEELIEDDFGALILDDFDTVVIT